MMQWHRLGLFLGVVVACSWAVSSGFAQDAPDGGEAAKTRAQNRGRLPAFYADVVDPQQREQIYTIQQNYQPQLDELRDQMRKLLDKRNAEMEAVLRPEQLTKVKQLADESRAKAQERAASRRPAANASSPTTAEATQSPASDAANEAREAKDASKPADASKPGEAK